MLSLLSIIAPVFALIACGYVTRRIGVLGTPAVSELNRFVVYLALPALLFDVMAHASWAELAQPRFIAAFGLSCGIIFFAIVAASLVARQPLSTAAINGLLGSYANTAYIGFPVLLIVFGRESLVPVTIASIITVCVLNASAIVMIEVASQSERRPLRLAGKVAVSLAKNPILIAPVLGVLYGATGLGFPEAAEAFLKMLGGSASPLALVVIGLVLAEPRAVAAAETQLSLALTAVKLIVHPALTVALATFFAVPSRLAAMAVVLAALPTGSGPLIVAEFYRLPALVTSAVILISTLAALLTLPLVLMGLGFGIGAAP
ncbi:MAG: AEC family transporter [Hyphomicrobium sp.]|jgi:malonate transporter|uniref:AEC family transporter n=1 Tax=Hyphomicrobium sp. TaxID=82 RepID=UPI0025B99815|nr:AEC family transporter [Hyphomicrobium sp.]MBX9861959.1 AEC family transporter [Hyphomicrobium sp.]